MIRKYDPGTAKALRDEVEQLLIWPDEPLGPHAAKIMQAALVFVLDQLARDDG